MGVFDFAFWAYVREWADVRVLDDGVFYDRAALDDGVFDEACSDDAYVFFDDAFAFKFGSRIDLNAVW